MIDQVVLASLSLRCDMKNNTIIIKDWQWFNVPWMLNWSNIGTDSSTIYGLYLYAFVQSTSSGIFGSKQ